MPNASFSAVFPAKAGNQFKYSWMPDQVRHDACRFNYETVNISYKRKTPSGLTAIGRGTHGITSSFPKATYRVINGRNKARYCEQIRGLRGNPTIRACFAVLAMTHLYFLGER